MTPSNDLINGWLLIAEASQQPRFLTFATLAAEWGANQEREACAKVCEDNVRAWSIPGSITKAECAAAIRSRGEVKP